MGRDKSRLRLGGASFIEHVVFALRPIVSPLRIVGGDPALAQELELPHQPDLLPGKGPLSGLHAALATATRSCVLALACDFPLVSTPFLTGLVELARSGEWDAVVPRTDRAVPVCAVYRNSSRVRDTFAARITAGTLSAVGALDALSVRWVDRWELQNLDPAGRCLTNVNTPDEYVRLAASYSSRD
jgi:molybdopterin-guanine dinucleotide biosynthesis protein A